MSTRFANDLCEKFGDKLKFYTGDGYVFCSTATCPKDSAGPYSPSNCHLCCYTHSIATAANVSANATANVTANNCYWQLWMASFLFVLMIAIVSVSLLTYLLYKQNWSFRQLLQPKNSTTIYQQNDTTFTADLTTPPRNDAFDMNEDENLVERKKDCQVVEIGDQDDENINGGSSELQAKTTVSQVDNFDDKDEVKFVHGAPSSSF